MDLPKIPTPYFNPSPFKFSPIANPVEGNQGQGAQGFGPNEGLYATAGLASLYGSFAGAAGQRLNLPQFESPYNQGQPSYDGGRVNAVTNAQPQGATGGEIAGDALQGAGIGTAILPGIGTAIGAGIGAIGGAISGAIRGNKEDTEKNRAMEAQRNYQKQFNDAASGFSKSQDASREYNKRMNNYSRYENLYRTPQQYA